MDESSRTKEKERLEVNCSESEDYATSNAIKEALKDLPEALSFIQRLQECILRQRTLIHRLYSKLKEESSKKKLPVVTPTKDESTQTVEDDFRELVPNPVQPKDLVEDIKQAAENAVHQSGFAYEATSGMYYDYNTGYYYDAELGLYYNGHDGTYYYFDESSKSFQYHSQVPVASHVRTKSISENIPLSKSPDLVKRKLNETNITEEITKKIKIEMREEGECSDSDEESEAIEIECEKQSVPIICDTKTISVESIENEPRLKVERTISSDNEIAKAWPPCLRVVVKETGLDNLVVGSLFIITCTGGSMGREGDHAIVIPDINISKHHAKVSFSEEEKCYSIVDLGSRNGTYVDGRRISVALRESDPVALRHGTMVKVGSTRLECHVHSGLDTCHECEPGCAQKRLPESSEATDKHHETKEARHRSELQRLRKRFGLDKLSPKEVAPLLAEGYKDRAEERRKTVGSQDHNEKTETASVHQSIKNTNKGFKMLSKMGWAEGQSLGKDSTKGILEPVTLEQRVDKVGLGSDQAHLPAADPKTKKKAEVWKKAQKRFQELDEQ